MKKACQPTIKAYISRSVIGNGSSMKKWWSTSFSASNLIALWLLLTHRTGLGRSATTSNIRHPATHASSPEQVSVRICKTCFGSQGTTYITCLLKKLMATMNNQLGVDPTIQMMYPSGSSSPNRCNHPSIG